MRGNTEIIIPELTVTALVALMVASTAIAVIYMKKENAKLILAS